MTPIKFGTSGWRGIIAEDFTFANARLVCQAIAGHLKGEGIAQQGVVIGYDTRFLSENFAATAAEVMAGNGIPCYFTNRDCPTPVVSFAIREGQRAGGINITASHNPPEYNGVKFSPASGGPAPENVTKPIETRANELAPGDVKLLPLSQARSQGLVTDIDPRPEYFQHLRSLVDVEVLKRSGLRVVVDALYGTGRGYLDTFLQEAGVEVELLHGYRDALFGGHRPEPSAEFLGELAALIVKSKAHLGLATDADADRFGVMDSRGEYHEANEILALLLDYLIETRGWEGGVARSVASTHLIDRVAAFHGRKVFETKVGFKYLGEYITNEQALLVGEESEGFSMKNHLPEKDGILADLLVAEMVARKGKDLSQLLEDLFAKVGPVYNRRVNLSLAPETKVRLMEHLKNPPRSFAGKAVKQHVTIDGHKFILEDGSWVCFRPSGTEPVVRFYLEDFSSAGLEKLQKAGEALLREV
ncbi:MAG: phosphoglucomutase/phosphomannomutase family protein [Deltaproteobacteria bacterium]|nr:MAG: phosphoglucomutase/phosphomannomutase family protein [Deltaproteobacteria bacterium]